MQAFWRRTKLDNLLEHSSISSLLNATGSATAKGDFKTLGRSVVKGEPTFAAKSVSLDQRLFDNFDNTSRRAACLLQPRNQLQDRLQVRLGGIIMSNN
jgi:hypothetical protein